MDENPTPKVEGNITDVLDEVPTPTSLVDRAGVVRWQNRASLELRGNRVGSSITDSVVPEESEQALAILARVIASGEPEELSGRGVGGPGVVVRFRARASLVRTSGGDPLVAFFAISISGPEDARAPAALEVQLGPRQLEILQLLAAGRTTEEIAKQLSLSRATVRNYIAGTLAALGVHSRLQAVAAARKGGLIEP